MKLKLFLVTAVLATAILCSAGIAYAQSTSVVDQITQQLISLLTQTIPMVKQQITAIVSQNSLPNYPNATAPTITATNEPSMTCSALPTEINLSDDGEKIVKIRADIFNPEPGISKYTCDYLPPTGGFINLNNEIQASAYFSYYSTLTVDKPIVANGLVRCTNAYGYPIDGSPCEVGYSVIDKCTTDVQCRIRYNDNWKCNTGNGKCEKFQYRVNVFVSSSPSPDGFAIKGGGTVNPSASFTLPCGGKKDVIITPDLKSRIDTTDPNIIGQEMISVVDKGDCNDQAFFVKFIADKCFSGNDCLSGYYCSIFDQKCRQNQITPPPPPTINPGFSPMNPKTVSWNGQPQTVTFIELPIGTNAPIISSNPNFATHGTTVKITGPGTTTLSYTDPASGKIYTTTLTVNSTPISSSTAQVSFAANVIPAVRGYLARNNGNSAGLCSDPAVDSALLAIKAMGYNVVCGASTYLSVAGITIIPCLVGSNPYVVSVNLDPANNTSFYGIGDAFSGTASSMSAFGCQAPSGPSGPPTPPAPAQPVTPVITSTSLIPGTISAGAPDWGFVVKGIGFGDANTDNSVVTINTTNIPTNAVQIPTTFRSSTELYATIPATYLLTPGTLNIGVRNLNDMTISATTLPFTITAPVTLPPSNPPAPQPSTLVQSIETAMDPLKSAVIADQTIPCKSVSLLSVMSNITNITGMTLGSVTCQGQKINSSCSLGQFRMFANTPSDGYVCFDSANNTYVNTPTQPSPSNCTCPVVAINYANPTLASISAQLNLIMQIIQKLMGR